MASIEKTLSYKDISLITRHISDIESRNDVLTETKFGKYFLTTPIIASPMPDVCDGHMAKILYDNGSFGFIHRFLDINSQLLEYLKCKDCGCAIGINEDLDRFLTLYDNGCRYFCIDTANGASRTVGRFIEQLYQKYNDLYIIAGNVHTKEGFKFLSQFPLLGIRCGIAGGSVCSTKVETGIYLPIVNVILECYEISKQSDILLIADSGINYPSDMCKAIALGADLVMAGRLFASSKESPAKMIKKDGKLTKLYRGAASFSVQKDNGKQPKYVEGIEDLIEYTGSIVPVLDKFNKGLRSSMSYMNAQTITEFKNNVNWCVID